MARCTHETISSQNRLRNECDSHSFEHFSIEDLSTVYQETDEQGDETRKTGSLLTSEIRRTATWLVQHMDDSSGKTPGNSSFCN